MTLSMSAQSFKCTLISHNETYRLQCMWEKEERLSAICGGCALKRGFGTSGALLNPLPQQYKIQMDAPTGLDCSKTIAKLLLM